MKEMWKTKKEYISESGDVFNVYSIFELVDFILNEWDKKHQLNMIVLDKDNNELYYGNIEIIDWNDSYVFLVGGCDYYVCSTYLASKSECNISELNKIQTAESDIYTQLATYFNIFDNFARIAIA